MSDPKTIYFDFFKAQDRFLNAQYEYGFEPDIIADYIHSAVLLGSHHEKGARAENLLLCELFLRQVYTHLLDAIANPLHSGVFRRVCLDSIHTPLHCLQRYYCQIEHGDIKFIQLKQKLQHVQAPLD